MDIRIIRPAQTVMIMCFDKLARMDLLMSIRDSSLSNTLPYHIFMVNYPILQNLALYDEEDN